MKCVKHTVKCVEHTVKCVEYTVKCIEHTVKSRRVHLEGHADERLVHAVGAQLDSYPVCYVRVGFCLSSFGFSTRNFTPKHL